MDEQELVCPDCRSAYALADNYCRRCGMYVAAVRPPTALTRAEGLVHRAAEAIEPYRRERAPLPAPVRKAATAVAVGAALQVGLGLASRYFAAQAGQKAARAAVVAPRGRSSRQLAPRESGMPSDIAAVSETVVVRRVWIRKP